MLTNIQRLRYDVYCLERRYLAAEDFPDGREWDPYDDFSVHCAAVDAAGHLTGAVRLVPDSPLGFPLEAHATRLDEAFQALPRAQTAEISRLIVAKPRRALAVSRLRRRYPEILLRLFREVNRESAKFGYEYWLAAMEPSLQRLLRCLLGYDFVPIGPPMEYYGEVVPYLASVAEVRLAVARRPRLRVFFAAEDLAPVG